jgi:hypothetical protein
MLDPIGGRGLTLFAELAGLQPEAAYEQAAVLEEDDASRTRITFA